MTTRKIDVYNHVSPQAYGDLLQEMVPGLSGMMKRIRSIPMMYDMEGRARMMDQWPGYQQVLTIAAPPVETVVGPSESPILARAGNAEMKKICETRPDKFPAWVAGLPMNNVDASLEEMDRSVAEGARGVQIFTNVAGRALDNPEFYPIFERATLHHKIPIWMHPTRGQERADYVDEDISMYEIWQVLGWPYETSVAMSRMVFSGLFDKLPELRLITHHLGAMIPYFEGRVGPLWDQFGSRTAGERGEAYVRILDEMNSKGRRPIDYFRMFYNDTAIGGSAATIRRGLEFFGADRVLFATDCPLDPEGGPMFIRETIKAIDSLDLPAADRHKIYCGNALCMLGMDDHEHGHDQDH
jgi:predicted TIM-barrel fold metal-dependent hydrolase